TDAVLLPLADVDRFAPEPAYLLDLCNRSGDAAGRFIKFRNPVADPKRISVQSLQPIFHERSDLSSRDIAEELLNVFLVNRMDDAEPGFSALDGPDDA